MTISSSTVVRGDRIEPGRRVVEQQEVRSRRHRARDRHAAPLAAGQLRRHPVDVLAEADESQHLRRRGCAPGRPACRSPRPAGSRRSPPRSANRTARFPGTACRCRRGRASARARSCRSIRSPLTKIAPGVGPKQPENELEHDGFPGAAGAEQDPHAALRDGEADIAQDDVIVEGERHLVEHDGRRVSRLFFAACCAITSVGLQRGCSSTQRSFWTFNGLTKW